MADFTVTISDPAHLFGLAAAVARKNASPGGGGFDEASYLQFIIDQACASYAQDFPMPSKATYQAALDALSVAKLTATPEDARKIEVVEASLTAIKDGKLQDIPAVEQAAEVVG